MEFELEWDDACLELDRAVAMEAEWKAHEARNFDEAQWRGPDVSSGGWEVTPPACKGNLTVLR
jgi:hypothetical protein